AAATTSAASAATATASTTAAGTPVHAMQAGRDGKRLRRRSPERGGVRNSPATSTSTSAASRGRSRVRIGSCRRVAERRERRTARVENLQRDGPRRGGLQVVVDRRTVRRILRL